MGNVPHLPVVVVGGGQAGLSMSHYLRGAGLDHLVFERRTAMHTWREHRWDNFCLVTPNWQCRLPGYEYRGDEPHGFMRKAELLAYLDGFKRHVGAPLREGVTVTRVRPGDAGRYRIETSDGDYSADQVVVASGGYRSAVLPRIAERMPREVLQVHSEHYRNAEALPAGAVLVVGTGQSGAQIAEDLHLAGRRVFLAVGTAPRCARFYRGKDVVDWLAEMNYYDMPVTDHPLREGVRDNTNHYVTGRDGGRDLDLRRFAVEGMELFGALRDVTDGTLQFAPDLGANLDQADEVYNGINASIDRYIEAQGIAAPSPSRYAPVWTPPEERTHLALRDAGVKSVVWCVGFKADFSWLEAPVFDGRGAPVHRRGVTGQRGLYFLGLPWLHTWGSGRFSGIARDAAYLAERLVVTNLGP
jgi:putative flavoprotein involved in K+ transport